MHFVRERNIYLVFARERKGGGHANNSLENESFSFLSQKAKNLTCPILSSALVAGEQTTMCFSAGKKCLKHA